MAELLGLLADCPAGLPGLAVADEQTAIAEGLPLVLGWQQQCLSLWRPGGKEKPLSVDFQGGKQGFRLAAERVRHERLIKALGKPAVDAPHTVLDATAGLGRDAALIAQAGFTVLLAEQSPVVHALLADGLRRAPPSLAEKMTLLPCAASDSHTLPPLYALYLDPMFPSREKSAAIKKDLLWLQQLCPYPDALQEQQLLSWARSQQAQRVVVKRPVKAAPLAGQPPHHSQQGKTVRFDVYI